MASLNKWQKFIYQLNQQQKRFNIFNKKIQQRFYFTSRLLPIKFKLFSFILLTRFAVIQPIMRINDDPDEEQIRMSKRLKRFRKFASIEYAGVYLFF
ncbi:unnamed protein product [Meloidogyne enterolobii]|uniref:Uncharacterized protein n=1 Tax=Meloidogyne enterolobii TaxID=390850 RepID=A0ACB1AKZ3_MELEN